MSVEYTFCENHQQVLSKPLGPCPNCKWKKEPWQSFADNLKQTTSWQYLNLKRADIDNLDDYNIGKYLGKNCSLLYLCLSDNHLGMDYNRTINRFWLTCEFPNLLVLEASSCDLSDTYIIDDLLTSGPRFIDISHNYDFDTLPNVLNTFLHNKHVLGLNCSGMLIKPDDLASITTFLTENTTLKYLNLGDMHCENKLDFVKDDVEKDMLQIVTALGKNTSLQTFSLHGYMPWIEISEKVGSTLIQSLFTNTTLTDLELDYADTFTMLDKNQEETVEWLIERNIALINKNNE